MSTKGGHRGTCKDTFNKCLHVGDNIDEVDARLLQGIIPDMVIDARDCDAGPFPTSNPLVGCKTLVEHKTLASLLVSVQARVKKVQTDIQKRAEELDSRHPGSTFAQELRAYGPYLVLVTGPFGNLSSDFKTFVDFIARERDADNGAPKHQPSSRTCGPSARFGAADWASHFSRLGSAYR